MRIDRYSTRAHKLRQHHERKPDDSKAKLRIEFIGMAFALAVGQVGLEVGEFYSHGYHISEHIYVFTHLFLGSYIIASSWVGWQKSKSLGHLQEISNVFAKAFILLLIDLFLVICYFIIVKSVEKPYENTFQKTISVNPELFWSEVTFGAYIFWDIISKLWDFNSNRLNLRFHPKAYGQRGWQAPVCFLLLLLLDSTMGNSQSPSTVIEADIYILVVFVLFRGMKETIDDARKHKVVILFKYILYRILPVLFVLAYYGHYIFKITSCFRHAQ